MKKHLITAFLMTIATTILLGVLYPLLITALAQVLFKDKANGQIRYRSGQAIRCHQLWRDEPRAHQPEADGPHSGRCEKPARGESLATGSGGSHHYLGIRTGSRNFSGRRGVSGSPFDPGTAPPRSPNWKT